MSFGTEQEFPLPHVFLFAISGYIKIGSFGFRIKNLNTLMDENCGSWFGRCHSVYLAPDKTSAVRHLPILLRFLMGTAGVVCYAIMNVALRGSKYH